MLEDLKSHQRAQVATTAENISANVESDDATVVNVPAQDQVQIEILGNRINALQMVINLERRLRRDLERQMSKDEPKKPEKIDEIRPAKTSIIEQATAKNKLSTPLSAEDGTAQKEVSINTLQSRLLVD